MDSLMLEDISNYTKNKQHLGGGDFKGSSGYVLHYSDKY
jgi:hypothetical protein